MTGASGLDWGHETLHSLWWTCKALVVIAVVFLAVVALLVRFTRWGEQFWQITGAYYTGRRSLVAWGLLVVVLWFEILGVRMTVLFSYYYNDMYSALQFAVQALADHKTGALAKAEHSFWNSIRLFAVLATLSVLRALTSYWINQVLQIRWWSWLNARVSGDWLSGRAYYRNRFVDESIDNPDQRIQQDTQDFVNGSFAFAFGGGAGGGYAVVGGGAIGSGLTLVSFTPILWKLSGPLEVFGWNIPRALVFATFLYVLVSTVIAFWLGFPLIRLNFWFQRLNANFRYALIRLRVNAESVAFYHGERVERGALAGKFARVIDNYWAIVYRTLKYTGWNLVSSQISQIFTVLFLAPRIFAGTATLGDFQQAGNAFDQVQGALSMPQQSFDAFTYYRSTLIRLHGLQQADRAARALPALATSEDAEGLELEGVRITKPDGSLLIDGLTLRLRPGDAMVVKGNSGSGKTTLLRGLAGMWPYAHGSARRPLGDRTLFLSQLPYLPMGDLRTAVVYPAQPDEFEDALLREVLGKVGLEHLAERLGADHDWAAILSPGEQQRIGFARVLLIRPACVFLDEATSALDEGLEFLLYQLIRAEVPDAVVVSVAHRSTVDVHHSSRLELDGNGVWRMTALT